MRRFFVFLIIIIFITSIFIIYTNTSKNESKYINFLDTNQITYEFSQPEHNINLDLIKVITSVQNTLDIAIYSITKDDIINTIIEAKNRGINVRIITDSDESKNRSENTRLNLLIKSGIPIKINTHHGLMHLKMTIIDKKIAAIGSYNYTNAATFNNDEILVILNNSNIAQAWDDKFENMWNDKNNFKFYK